MDGDRKRTKLDQSNIRVAYTIRAQDVLDEFITSRESIGATRRTVSWYIINLGRYLAFLKEQGRVGIDDAANELNIAEFLAFLQKSRVKNCHGEVVEDRKTLSDSYIHGFARNIRTFVYYAADRGYIAKRPKIKMPKIHRKKRPFLTSENLEKLLQYPRSTRDYALITFAVASGLRLNELILLNWGDVDIKTGVVDVLEGKGEKYRVSKIDKETLRTLIQYRNELSEIDPDFTTPDMPVFQTNTHTRFTIPGLRSNFVRLYEQSGVKFSAHALRRTFASRAVKSGLDLVWIQELMGHANITTTRDYVQGLDNDDLFNAYDEHTPLRGIDHKPKIKRNRK